MLRFCVVLAIAAIMVFMMVGCGGSQGGAGEGTSAAVASTTSPSSPTTAASTTQATVTTHAASTTEPPSTTQAASDDGWKTVVTLRSSDAPWQGMNGILLSEPFDATGDIRVVLDMPDGGEADGVIIAIVSADKATDVTALLGAIGDGVVLTVLASAPTKVTSGLSGTYVVVNSVPTAKPWSLEVQVRP
jgi:hypothetical protein